MKKGLQNDNKKKPVIPDREESELAKTLEGQVLLMVQTALDKKAYIEAQTLSWATIEKILLPRLIGWIAKEHNLALPNEVYKLNSQSINLLYLTLSHDVELFEKLEEARKMRNTIIHELTKLVDMNTIKKKALESGQANVLLHAEIMKRFSGEVIIPSMNLYVKGWNDAINAQIERHREELRKLDM